MSNPKKFSAQNLLIELNVMANDRIGLEQVKGESVQDFRQRSAMPSGVADRNSMNAQGAWLHSPSAGLDQILSFANDPALKVR